MNKTKIIAEIAQGYEGKYGLLKRLTKQVSNLKVNGVKYQLVYADELATPDYEHYSLFKSLEMNIKYWKWVKNYLDKSNIKLYFDIFGDKSFQIARSLNANGVKISTTEFYNSELIKKSLKSFKEVFISVGGIPIKDIKLLNSKNILKFKNKITLLYGLQSEPTLINENNLLKLKALMNKFPNFKFGFMDHSHGGKQESLYLSLMALGQGVKLIEKHFTLDRRLKIEDYISGLDNNNFIRFIDIIRHYELALGYDSTKLSKEEKIYSNKALKVVVAKKDLNNKTIIKRSDIALKRTGQKISKNFYFKIEDLVGKKIKEKIKLNAPISRKDL